jgi:hypothetical protein
MSEPNAEAVQPKSGCATGCVRFYAALIVLIIILFAGGLLWNQFFPEDEYRMEGSVIIASEANFDSLGSFCHGVGEFDRVNGLNQITIEGNGSYRVDLNDGVVNERGDCEFSFETHVNESDTYTFRPDGAQGKSVERRFIDTLDNSGDTILKPRIQLD